MCGPKVWPHSLTNFTLQKYSICPDLELQTLTEGAGFAGEKADPGAGVGKDQLSLERLVPKEQRDPM